MTTTREYLEGMVFIYSNHEDNYKHNIANGYARLREECACQHIDLDAVERCVRNIKEQQMLLDELSQILGDVRVCLQKLRDAEKGGE